MKRIWRMIIPALCLFLLVSCGREEETVPAYETAVETISEAEGEDSEQRSSLAKATLEAALTGVTGLEVTDLHTGVCTNYGLDYRLYQYTYTWDYGSGQYGILLWKNTEGEWTVLTEGADLETTNMYQIITDYLEQN